MCVVASVSEVMEATGAIIPFSLEAISVQLERGLYI